MRKSIAYRVKGRRTHLDAGGAGGQRAAESQRCVSSSSIRLAGNVSSRVKTSLRQTDESTSFMRADWTRLLIAAARCPARSDPQKSHSDLPGAMNRIGFWRKLLSAGIVPSSRYPVNASH
jgi:hypothetical protein